MTKESDLTVIGWIRNSYDNDVAIIRSEFHQKSNPKAVDKAKFEADMAQRTINYLTSGKEPTDRLERIWYEWYIGWGDCMVRLYNREGMTPSEDGSVPLYVAIKAVRDKRDEALKEFRNNRSR